MKIEVFSDDESTARAAAKFVVAEAAAAARGQCLMAVTGGLILGSCYSAEGIRNLKQVPRQHQLASDELSSKPGRALPSTRIRIIPSTRNPLI